jgi:hypothetical protein
VFAQRALITSGFRCPDEKDNEGDWGEGGKKLIKREEKSGDGSFQKNNECGSIVSDVVLFNFRNYYSSHSHGNHHIHSDNKPVLRVVANSFRLSARY